MDFWAGPLNNDGSSPTDCSLYDRLYKVSRFDVADYQVTGEAIPDLRDWPTGLGAPTLAPPGNGVDDDGDGQMDEAGEQVAFDISVPLADRVDRVIDLAAGERPAILGDQSIWWVMNDVGNTHELTQSQPLGIEVHGLAYASLAGGANGDITFYRFALYNRGEQPLHDAYLGLFADPDLGDLFDDYIGSDTTLGLAYVYNADNEDLSDSGYGYGTAPPAIGFDFVRGFAVPSAGDSAWVNGTQVPDYVNLAMTSFSTYPERPCGVSGCLPEEVGAFYNYLLGQWWDGTPFVYGGDTASLVPDSTKPTTRFMFSGDPVTGTGWTEANPDPFIDNEPPNSFRDRRLLMGMGPTALAPNERHEVTIGIFYARGEDHLDSITRLRAINGQVQSAFDAGLDQPPADPNVVRPRRGVVLEAPADGVDAQPADVTLHWHVAPEAPGAYYDVQLATNEAFTQLITQAVQTVNRLEVADLAISTPYYWRVRAVNEAGSGPWSETWRFTTSADPGSSLIRAFMTVSNAAGPIDPPDMAAFAFDGNGFPVLEGTITPAGSYPDATRPTAGVQQSTSDAVWGFHGGDVSSSSFGQVSEPGTFLARVVRNDNIARFSPFTYEMRFTQACADGINEIIETTDCLAARRFEDGEFVEVPFELWRSGAGASEDDPTDDVRLLPAICEAACGAGSQDGVFDIAGDHLVSGGDDDPASDWVYWYLPEDGGASPGEQGYIDFFFGSANIGGEVMARTVLVNLNGGSAPPYTASLPEPGTTFRILSANVDPPILSAPADLATNVLQPVSLYWNARPFLGHVLHVATDPGFSTLVVADTLEAVSSYPIEGLEAGRSYYWRMQLVATTGQPLSEWSDTWQFSISASAVATESASGLPTAYALEPNYPNPFNPSTTLRYALPEDGAVRLSVYDVLGRRVRLLVDEHQPAGWHDVAFDAGGLPSGTYFYVLHAGRQVQTRSMVLLR